MNGVDVKVNAVLQNVFNMLYEMNGVDVLVNTVLQDAKIIYFTYGGFPLMGRGAIPK